MIVNHICEIYLLFYLSVFLHETMHAVTAKIIGLPIEKFQVGDDLFAIKVGKISVSLNCLFGSHVSFDQCKLQRKSQKQIVLFFLSGPAVNMILILIGIILKECSPLYVGALLWINVYLFAEGVFPFIPKNNDLNKMTAYLKNRQSLQSDAE
ncbi:MAG: site-2 protease family protein [Lachnospiraceae bacterium]